MIILAVVNVSKNIICFILTLFIITIFCYNCRRGDVDHSSSYSVGDVVHSRCDHIHMAESVSEEIVEGKVEDERCEPCQCCHGYSGDQGETTNYCFLMVTVVSRERRQTTAT